MLLPNSHQCIFFCLFSAFQSYIQCVEPKVQRCQPEQFVVLRQYSEDKRIYSGPPYFCKKPEITYTITSTSKMKSDEIVTSGTLVQHNLHRMSKSLLLFILMVTSTSVHTLLQTWQKEHNNVNITEFFFSYANLLRFAFHTVKTSALWWWYFVQCILCA